MNLLVPLVFTCTHLFPNDILQSELNPALPFFQSYLINLNFHFFLFNLILSLAHSGPLLPGIPVLLSRSICISLRPNENITKTGHFSQAFNRQGISPKSANFTTFKPLEHNPKPVQFFQGPAK